MAKKDAVVEETVMSEADVAPEVETETVPEESLDEAGEPMVYEQEDGVVPSEEAMDGSYDAEPEQAPESPVDETVSAPDVAAYPVEGERNVVKELVTGPDGNVVVVERHAASSY